MNNKTVFVGISGGVDSAVSAALLKEQGYEVVGVFIRTWHPDFIECKEEEERRDAMRVCAHISIPFLTFNFENVYKKEVADYMIREYKAGRTPNPDVMCNREVKFGAFLKKALSMGADAVATGHYARLRRASKKYKVHKVFKGKKLYQNNEEYELLTGEDKTKDQSYFLWTLNQKQLSRILFPIGHLNKSDVRKLAKKFKLPVANKKDSQGICFLGAVDLKNFLKHYIKEKKGKVKNEEGKIVGYHNGVSFFTLGERRGFEITDKKPNDKPYYVVGKNIKKNILFVSQNINSGLSQKNEYEIQNINWINKLPEKNKLYKGQIRYHGEFLDCNVLANTNSKKAEILFKKNILVASGQSIVIYDKGVCIGGGVVI